MTFTESNTVEALVRDLLCGGVTHHTTVGPGLARRQGAVSGLGWHYLAPTHLPRPAHEVLVEDHVHEALLRLNPEIAAQPDRADDVLYRLRAILMGVRTDGLVKANEEFAAWLAGERSRPFGADGEHVTVRLVDFEDVERNQYVVTTQYNPCTRGPNERRSGPGSARQLHFLRHRQKRRQPRSSPGVSHACSRVSQFSLVERWSKSSGSLSTYSRALRSSRVCTAPSMLLKRPAVGTRLSHCSR